EAPVSPYNMAVARPLAEWAAVRAALAWLTVLAELVTYKRCEPRIAGAALLSGHCQGGKVESSGRAQVDTYWRNQAQVSVSAQGFASKLEQHAPLLAQAWEQC